MGRSSIVLSLVSSLASLAAIAADYPIRSAEMTKTRVTRGFWFDRLETNRTATLKSNWAKCNETPRIANFTNAANRTAGTFGGIPFDDSDVYKVVEGTAYVLAEHPDPELEKYVTWFIGEVAKAQEPDGYLYTARTLGYERMNWGKAEGWHVGMMGPTRWSNIPASHELYNVGHMYEAAVAWHQVTGRDDFLKIAEKNAALIGRTFGPGEFQLRDVPGHEEIELALCKLYRETGKRQYLDLAKHFVDARGCGPDRRVAAVFTQEGDLKKSEEMTLPGAYCQNHLPFVKQREAVGHAVRAGYLYCGATDIAALTGDRDYAAANDALWNDVVSCKLHLNGGIGARPKGEAFGQAYELPNDKDTAPDLKADQTYLETCAAIALALWNDRLFRFHGESKYVDVLERTLYNGMISGVSLSGDEFFYPNPLACKGGYKRSKWFGCSCCPVNIVRFVPQIPSMIYATGPDKTLYWNLFASSKTAVRLPPVNSVELEQTTDYPWSGKSILKFTRIVSKPMPKFALKIRIPGWAKGQPVSSDLYVQTEPSSVMGISVVVDGRAVNAVPGKDGYITIEREWKVGSTVEVDLPMPVKRIRAHAKVEADKGRLAVERGPIVYCAEGCDNGGKAYDAVLPADATFTDDTITIGDKTFPALKASNGLKLIPYCLWDNREPGNELQVWFKER